MACRLADRRGAARDGREAGAAAAVGNEVVKQVNKEGKRTEREQETEFRCRGTFDNRALEWYTSGIDREA